MRMGLKQKLLSYLIVLIGFIILYTNTLFAQDNTIRRRVEEALNSPWGDTTEQLAEIGKPAVLLLLDILKGNEFPEFKFPAVAVEALGIIGDKTATPVLIELLQNPTCQIKPFIIEALGRIADPAAEQAILADFEQAKNQNNPWQLDAAHALLKVASEPSKQKVKELAEHVLDLYIKAYWTFDEQAGEQAFKELSDSPFDNSEIVHALLPGLIIDLKDPDILIKAIKYRQLEDETGSRFTEGFKILAETGSSEMIETIFKFAENNEEIWTPALSKLTEEQRKEFSQVPALIRLSAVESLLTIEGIDMGRITQSFKNISAKGLREIPLTVKIEPDKWNYQWKKTEGKGKNENEGGGHITCYLGNIPGGYSVRDVLPETIRLNKKVTPSKKGKTEKIHAKIKERRQGFIGETLEVKFSKSEVIKSMERIWPGEERAIMITGRLKDEKPFSGTYKIKISKSEHLDDNNDTEKDNDETNENNKKE